MKSVKVGIIGSNGQESTLMARVRKDGILFQGASPLFVGQDFKDRGIPMPRANQKWESYSQREQELALRIDDPRVSFEETPKLRAFLNGEEEDTRERQNAFLKSKGYRWSRENVYNSGPGEMESCWFLLNPSGEAVVGWKDVGGMLAEFGSVKVVLTRIGYYGEEAAETLAAKETHGAERRSKREKLEKFFQDESNRVEISEERISFMSPPIKIGRNQYRIEPGALWQETANWGDGDMWNHNNCDFGIARKFRFDAEIAEILEELA